jgi:hypothetical protein
MVPFGIGPFVIGSDAAAGRVAGDASSAFVRLQTPSVKPAPSSTQAIDLASLMDVRRFLMD